VLQGGDELSSGSEFQAPESGAQTTEARPAEARAATKDIPPGWHKPLPEKLPEPGYWPAIMALGITFMFWGLAVGFNEVVSTIIIIYGIGLILFIVSLVGWIGDLRYERRDENE
jgi:hypothetical protein